MDSPVTKTRFLASMDGRAPNISQNQHVQWKWPGVRFWLARSRFWPRWADLQDLSMILASGPLRSLLLLIYRLHNSHPRVPFYPFSSILHFHVSEVYPSRPKKTTCHRVGPTVKQIPLSATDTPPAWRNGHTSLSKHPSELQAMFKKISRRISASET